MELIEIINAPMQENDADAKTVGEYLKKLLLTLWEEQEGFSGKRPFGNSGWDYELYTALIKCGAVDGFLDEDGYVESVDYCTADKTIVTVINAIFDAVPVVRCEECKHARQVDTKEPKYKCVHICRYGATQWLDSNDFCSYGEKRDAE